MLDVAPHERIEAWLERDLLARCRPGERLASPLSLVRGRDTGDGERIDLVSLTLQPSGETLQVVLTFGSAEALAEDLGAGGADMAYSPALSCLAEVFPRDGRLADLADASRPDWVHEMMAGRGGFSGAPGTGLEISVLRYRPHSRAVLLYRERDGSGAVTAEAIAKVFRSPSKAERAWRLASWIAERTPGAPIVPRPYLLRGSVVVMEKVPGVPLDALLEQPSDAIALEAVRAAARAIRAFHAVPPGDVKRTKPSKDMKAIAELAQEVSARANHRRDVDRVVSALKQRADEAHGSSDPLLVHGSFKPTAVLFGDGRATIVDLDYAGLGDPIDDIAHFTGHVRLLAAAKGNDRLDALAEEFLSEYGPLPGGEKPKERVHVLVATLLALSALKVLAKAGADELVEQGLFLIQAAERFLA